MNIPLEEFVTALQNLNGLQHLGQIAGFHLMVDEGERTYWQRADLSHFPLCGGTFETVEEAWFDCLFTNHKRYLLLALLEMNSRKVSMHPQALQAYQRWLAVAKPIGEAP